MMDRFSHDLHGYLASKRRSTVVGQVVILVVVALLAVSRADNGALPPLDLVVLVGGITLLLALVTWPAALFEGAADRISGHVARPPAAELDDNGPDPFAGRRFWHRSLRWSVAATAWAMSGAVVVAAALRGHAAPFPVVVGALVLLGGVVVIVLDTSGRAVGARVAGRFLTARPAPVGLRRRGWRDVALPFAIIQVLANAVFAWLLFAGHALCLPPGTGDLTRAEILADALIVIVLLTAISGLLANRWGQLDAVTGRVIVPDEARAGVTSNNPLGGQALLYLGAGALVLAKGVEWLLPSNPSLLRVVIVRSLFAGSIAFVAAGLGYARGAVNGAARATSLPALDDARPIAAEPPSPRTRWQRRVALGGATALVAGFVLAVSPTSASRSDADDLAVKQITAEAESFALRVEYDIPVPASTGTVPHVVGELRRAGGSENAKGFAAAPTRFDLVVGGRVASPDGKPGGDDDNKLPQTECFYPGQLLDTSFTFPNDVRPDAAGAPPLAYATARCDAGPTAELHARSSESTASADALLRPVDGVLHSDTRSWAQGVKLLDGLMTIDSIEAVGSSALTGKPNEAGSTAHVNVEGIRVPGLTFSLRDGDLVVGNAVVPTTSAAARGVLDAAKTALAPMGCDLTILSTPAAFPQGFVLARKPPVLGIAADGTSAGSMAGGMLLMCDLPQNLAEPTGFSPQRMQAVIGFAYTAATATDDVGGFGLPSLASGAGTDGVFGGPDSTTTATGALGASGGLGDNAAAGALPPAPALTTAAASTAVPYCDARLVAANWFADQRWPWMLALIAWGALTELGLRRLRVAVGDMA